jgi:hypothetical protein
MGPQWGWHAVLRTSPSPSPSPSLAHLGSLRAGVGFVLGFSNMVRMQDFWGIGFTRQDDSALRIISTV